MVAQDFGLLGLKSLQRWSLANPTSSLVPSWLSSQGKFLCAPSLTPWFQLVSVVT